MLTLPVHVIKLTETREITPYLWVHPDEERRWRSNDDRQHGRGIPRDWHRREDHTHTMRLGDDPAAIAKRLTMEIYRTLRGETAPTVTGFGRALNCPASGVA
jgi:hypothetical protein